MVKQLTLLLDASLHVTSPLSSSAKSEAASTHPSLLLLSTGNTQEWLCAIHLNKNYLVFILLYPHLKTGNIIIALKRSVCGPEAPETSSLFKLSVSITYSVLFLLSPVSQYVFIAMFVRRFIVSPDKYL